MRGNGKEIPAILVGLNLPLRIPSISKHVAVKVLGKRYPFLQFEERIWVL
jgi:hypothetical protein